MKCCKLVVMLLAFMLLTSSSIAGAANDDGRYRQAILDACWHISNLDQWQLFMRLSATTISRGDVKEISGAAIFDVEAAPLAVTGLLRTRLQAGTDVQFISTAVHIKREAQQLKLYHRTAGDWSQVQLPVSDELIVNQAQLIVSLLKMVETITPLNETESELQLLVTLDPHLGFGQLINCLQPAEPQELALLNIVATNSVPVECILTLERSTGRLKRLDADLSKYTIRLVESWLALEQSIDEDDMNAWAELCRSTTVNLTIDFS